MGTGTGRVTDGRVVDMKVVCFVQPLLGHLSRVGSAVY